MDPRAVWSGRTRRAAAIALVAGLVVGGCTDGDDDPSSSGPTGGDGTETVEIDGETIAALIAYDSCDAFLADVKEEALERVGPYGFGEGWVMPFATEGDTAEAVDSVGGGDDGGFGSPVAREQSAGPDVSETNVQEAGVDEPDVVKTDGEVMVVVVDQSLRVLDVTDPAAPELLSSTSIDGWEAEVLLSGDRLLLIERSDIDTVARLATQFEDMRIAGHGYDATTITQYDLSDPTDPRVERAWSTPGSYLSARMVDDVVRIVVQGSPSATLPFVYPSTPGAEESAEAANRAVVEASTLEDWVPTLVTTDADGDVVDESAIAPCDRLYRPSTFSGVGMVTVLTADLGAEGLGDGAGVGVLSTGETVYASAESLYVATNRWTTTEETDEQGMPRWDGEQSTEVHQFALDGAAPAEYLASGSTSGRVLDQWSLSEHDGHLRMAVTDDMDESVSSVVVFGRDGDRLEEVGRVGDLGRGEQIYAVRFIGDRGFVVTFRQIDPLYALDLSDPTSPAVTGELEIPGFSSYLHPVGEDLILGVGQEGTEDGQILGGQVSLFDVSDPAAPQRLATLPLGEDAQSEVEYDHRAFLHHDGVSLLPYSSWRWDEQTGEESHDSGVIGVEVGATTLDERGRVTQEGMVRRSVVIDGRLLTVSDEGILSSDLATLAPGAWLGF